MWEPLALAGGQSCTRAVGGMRIAGGGGSSTQGAGEGRDTGVAGGPFLPSPLSLQRLPMHLWAPFQAAAEAQRGGYLVVSPLLKPQPVYSILATCR